MKFTLECDEMDGLVFIDKSRLAELNSDILYSMDILLDPFGETELTFDFPNEDWKTVWIRETKQVRKLCEQGKMILWLFNGVEKECELKESDEIERATKWLHIPSGTLLAVTASELIQSLPHPELQMETIFTLKVEAGWHAFWNHGIDSIMHCKSERPHSIPENIQELCSA